MRRCQCNTSNSLSCDNSDGHCICNPGWTGKNIIHSHLKYVLTSRLMIISSMLKVLTAQRDVHPAHGDTTAQERVVARMEPHAIALQGLVIANPDGKALIAQNVCKL